MRVCLSPHEFVASKINDVFHVIDGIIRLAAWPPHELRIAIPSSTTKPSLTLLLLRGPTSLAALFDPGLILLFALPSQGTRIQRQVKTSYHATNETQ